VVSAGGADSRGRACSFHRVGGAVGLVMIEAMLSGVPVLGTARGAVPEGGGRRGHRRDICDDATRWWRGPDSRTSCSIASGSARKRYGGGPRADGRRLPAPVPHRAPRGGAAEEDRRTAPRRDSREQRVLSPSRSAELLGTRLTSLPDRPAPTAGPEARQPLRRGGSDGDIWPPDGRDSGRLLRGHRFLSKLRLTVAGGPPVVLSDADAARVHLAGGLSVTSRMFGGLFQDPVTSPHPPRADHRRFASRTAR